MSQPPVKKIWLRSLFLSGPAWGVLWSWAMAFMNNRQFLEIFLPIGALGGLAFGAAMGFFATRQLAHVRAVSPGTAPTNEALLAAAAKLGLEVTEANPTQVSFLHKKPVLGYRLKLTVEPLPDQITVAGSRSLVTALLRQLGRPAVPLNKASSPSGLPG